MIAGLYVDNDEAILSRCVVDKPMNEAYTPKWEIYNMTLKDDIRHLANEYAETLDRQIEARMQELETLYQEVGGEYYHSNAAWSYVHKRTKVNLKRILDELAQERMV